MSHRKFLERFFDRVCHVEDPEAIDAAIEAISPSTPRRTIHDAVESGERIGFRATAVLTRGGRDYTLPGGAMRADSLESAIRSQPTRDAASSPEPRVAGTDGPSR